MSKKEVVVTGFDVLSPVGVDLDSFWSALVEGKSGVSHLESLKTASGKRPVGAAGQFSAVGEIERAAVERGAVHGTA